MSISLGRAYFGIQAAVGKHNNDLPVNRHDVAKLLQQGLPFGSPRMLLAGTQDLPSATGSGCCSCVKNTSSAKTTNCCSSVLASTARVEFARLRQLWTTQRLCQQVPNRHPDRGWNVGAVASWRALRDAATQAFADGEELLSVTGVPDLS